MNTATRLTVYGAALALVATGAWAIGTAVGPVSDAAGTPAAPHTDTHGTTVTAGSEGPDGLASAKDGYILQPTGTTFTPGTTTPFSFRITRSDGTALTAYDVEHDKRMHLIVVRRDLAGFQHVHPEMAPDGTWTVPLTLTQAGSYRALADFKPTGGKKLTLGVDLAVPGVFQPVSYRDFRVSAIDDYEVSLEGQLVPGRSSRLMLTVRRNGQDVTDLQPYLGAYGHLVALRVGDLAYLHVHPDNTTTAGPNITFFAEVPSSGKYRLFLDFKHGDKVRTADFTLSTGSTNAPAPPAPPGQQGHGDDGHGH
ncbi:hypothetical protein [Kibdelosporangium phytohabitans]|uniref:Heavy metal-binding domain-containing protein n=1 Tax=Kibdelosporangium phytohabitans TaxID=860235 RepID=A0A0N7F4A2_9PSEU|nr:hypothetical protein [Kibdelosporangium phytohabitans]ALG10863.1 hypothetical protein AOZ06_31815 [Kibdelosporangium phytohabitans]MBE1462044.1 hypothetical protein [Kibdelosporangium phytohabitans]